MQLKKNKGCEPQRHRHKRGEPQRHRHQQLLPLPLILPPSFTDPMVTNVCDICLSIEGSTSVANDIFLNFWSLLKAPQGSKSIINTSLKVLTYLGWPKGYENIHSCDLNRHRIHKKGGSTGVANRDSR